jgi:hypothetical protein
VADDEKREDPSENAGAFVVEQMKAGADEATIVAMLEQRGVERGQSGS